MITLLTSMPADFDTVIPVLTQNLSSSIHDEDTLIQVVTEVATQVTFKSYSVFYDHGSSSYIYNEVLEVECCVIVYIF